MALGDKLPVVMGKEKAVANGVATLGADGKLAEAQRPTTDPAPTENSTNPVQSGGVYTALAALTGEDIPTSGTDSTTIAAALSNKADRQLSNLSNYQKALAAIGGKPRDNLLDNWYFVGGGSQQGDGQFPINQRGQTSYTAASANCIDRWKLFNSPTLALEADAISLTSSNTSAYESPSQLGQILSPEAIEQIKGRTVTLSVLTTQGLFSGPFTISPDGSSISGERIYMEDWYADLYVNPSISKIEFRFVSLNPNATLKIRAVKLELGPIQTLAYQDEAGGWQLFETPDYGEELAKCQRYFWNSLSPNGFSILGYALAISQAWAYLLIALPVSLRDGITPSLSTINFSNLFFIGTNGQETLAHSWMIDGSSAGDKVLIQCQGTFITGQTYLVVLTNSDTLSVSADL